MFMNLRFGFLYLFLVIPVGPRLHVVVQILSMVEAELVFCATLQQVLHFAAVNVRLFIIFSSDPELSQPESVGWETRIIKKPSGTKEWENNYRVVMAA